MACEISAAGERKEEVSYSRTYACLGFAFTFYSHIMSRNSGDFVLALFFVGNFGVFRRKI